MRTFEFEDVRDRCLSKDHVTEEFPFDENTCVWKVAGKVFALADIDAFDGVTLKCDPEYAVELREQHTGIIKRERVRSPIPSLMICKLGTSSAGSTISISDILSCVFNIRVNVLYWSKLVIESFCRLCGTE